MWMRLVNVCVWAYTKALVFFLWVARKTLKKEQYLNLCIGLGQLYATFGRSMMMRAIGFAIENNIEVTGEAPADQPSDDEGPPLNLPPGVEAAMLPTAPKEELPAFKADSGETLPLNFDPLPPYPVFEALFTAKYGRYGRCGAVLMGRPQMFGCRDLYTLLDKIQNDKDAPPQMRAFYGSMMTVVVHRFGHKFEPKAVS